MARKGLVIGISLGLIVLVVGGLLLTGIIPLPDSNASHMEIIFYDAEGNELGKAEPALGIQSPSFTGDIHSLDVVVYFKVTTDADWSYITTTCLLTIVTRLDTIQGSIVHTISEHRLGAINSDAEGTFYATYLMSTLLPDSKIDAAGKESGWVMRFDARVLASIGRTGEIPIPAEDTCATSLQLVWAEPTVQLESWFGDW